MNESDMEATAPNDRKAEWRARCTYVAITGDGNMFSVAVVDFARRRIETRTFPAESVDCKTVVETAHVLDEVSLPSLEQMARFLDREVIDKDNTQFLLELPQWQLDVGSPQLALLLFLAKRGYVEFPVVEPALQRPF